MRTDAAQPLPASEPGGRVVALISQLDRRLDRSSAELVLLMTLLTLLLHAERSWYVRVPITVLAVAGLLGPQLRRSQGFWWLVMSFTVAAVWHNRLVVDNHKYLFAYWTIAILASLYTAQPRDALARSARLLLGLTFFFATVAKLLSPDFLSGDFFEYTLLTDNRFRPMATLVAGLPEEAVRLNHAAVAALGDPQTNLTTVYLESSPRLTLLATVFTLWTLVIEAAIAAVFLLPLPLAVGRWRDGLLVAFVISTYALAPVAGFGCVLIALGIAQCPENRPLARLAYVVSFLLLQAYLAPWGALVELLFATG